MTKDQHYAIERGSTGHAVTLLQAALDASLKHYGFAWRKIKIDGHAGARTFDAANMVAWLRGFSQDELIIIGKRQKLTERDLQILLGNHRRSPAMVLRGHGRRAQAKSLRQKHHEGHFPPAPAGGEWVMYDGHEIPLWMAKINQAARDAGAWHGVVFSGRRDPKKSRGICEAMCGAPTCSGRCAGETSNHAGPPTFKGIEWEGAEDVTDAEGLREYCRTHDLPLRGGGEVLPADVPHFSHNGN